MTRTVPVKDLRRDLGPLLDEVSQHREHIVVTRRGRPAAVIIPHDEYTALEETAEILADLDALTALTAGLEADPAADVKLDDLRNEIARKRAVG